MPNSDDTIRWSDKSVVPTPTQETAGLTPPLNNRIMQLNDYQQGTSYKFSF